ncbi:hypothetical protein F5Y10DRAFT_230149 [Nemania abortiva]|nr:hypothetical protein F5Y10DRAFT_230149 [Nemania abortiva]
MDADRLHKRELSFANSFRPSKQYLYFASCINILRRQRLEVPGWWKDSFLVGNKEIWASKGPYLRRSTIRLMGGLASASPQISPPGCHRRMMARIVNPIEKEKPDYSVWNTMPDSAFTRWRSYLPSS